MENKVTASGREPELGLDSAAPAPIDQKTKQHRDHWVLPKSELAKGFIRPVRDRYRHLKCGQVTTMGMPIAETYARKPDFYGATFCAHCLQYLPVGSGGEFEWLDGSKVGT